MSESVHLAGSWFGAALLAGFAALKELFSCSLSPISSCFSLGWASELNRLSLDDTPAQSPCHVATMGVLLQADVFRLGIFGPSAPSG